MSRYEMIEFMNLYLPFCLFISLNVAMMGCSFAMMKAPPQSQWKNITPESKMKECSSSSGAAMLDLGGAVTASLVGAVALASAGGIGEKTEMEQDPGGIVTLITISSVLMLFSSFMGFSKASTCREYKKQFKAKSAK